MNLVILRGTVTRQPESRELGSGTELVTYELTVREPGRSAETVPVVCFDPPQATKAIAAGTSVVVIGRVRRRSFRAGGPPASRLGRISQLRGQQGQQGAEALAASIDQVTCGLGDEIVVALDHYLQSRLNFRQAIGQTRLQGSIAQVVAESLLHFCPRLL